MNYQKYAYLIVNLHISDLLLVLAAGLFVIAAQYMRRLDVCELILQKWEVKQQDQYLKTYFDQNKDGVLIFSQEQTGVADFQTVNNSFKALMNFESSQGIEGLYDKTVFKFDDSEDLLSLR